MSSSWPRVVNAHVSWNSKPAPTQETVVATPSLRLEQSSRPSEGVHRADLRPSDKNRQVRGGRPSGLSKHGEKSHARRAPGGLTASIADDTLLEWGGDDCTYCGCDCCYGQCQNYDDDYDDYDSYYYDSYYGFDRCNCRDCTGYYDSY